MKGNEFYNIGMKEFCRQNDIEHQDGYEFSHIKYNEDVNETYEYMMTRRITHDGSYVFEHMKMVKMFYELVKCQVLYREHDNIKDLKVINYEIGDLTITNVYNISNGKRPTGVTQTFELPIKCSYEFK